MKSRHYKKELLAYIDNEVDEHRRAEIARHLDDCEMCHDRHSELLKTASLASLLPKKNAPDHVWDLIDHRLRGDSPQGNTQTRYWPRIAVATAMASFILAIGVWFAVLTLQDRVDPVTTESRVTWRVEKIAGVPNIKGSSDNQRIAVGEILETNGASRALIKVADIGSVEIEPDSRVSFIGSTSREHRLSLERGGLYARISAPPRLFVVDTPSATAVDLGCEYKLDVDANGNSILEVKSGYVALEDGGPGAFVQAGAMCLTRKDKGIGMPFAVSASNEFRSAVIRFDFESEGSAAVDEILRLARRDDAITVWHLLSRVPEESRLKVVDALVRLVPMPAGVDLQGIQRLDNEMMLQWRYAVEEVLFYKYELRREP